MQKVAIMLNVQGKIFVSRSWWRDPFKSFQENPDDFLEIPQGIVVELPSEVFPRTGKYLAFSESTAFDLKNFFTAAQVKSEMWQRLLNPKFKGAN